MASGRMCVEWRLSQPDENLKKAVKMLNKEAITSGDDTSDNEGEEEDAPPQGMHLSRVMMRTNCCSADQ